MSPPWQSEPFQERTAQLPTLLEIDRARPDRQERTVVRAIDDIQYSIGEGPCTQRGGHRSDARRSGRLSDDSRWRVFGPRASELGVHSALSLPSLVTTGILGAINVYAHALDAFDDHSQECGETFAVFSASLAVQTQILDQTTRLVDGCQAG